MITSLLVGVLSLRENMLSFKILHLLAGAFSIIVGLFNLIILLSPIYRLEGVVEGFVALAWYRLNYYGQPLSISSLDSVNFLTIPFLTVSFYLMFAGVYHIFVLLRSGNLISSCELLLGGGLSVLAMVSLPLALFNVVSHEVGMLKVNFNGYTSAGYVHLGESKLYTEFIARFFSLPLIILTLSVFIVIVIAYFSMLEEER